LADGRDLDLLETAQVGHAELEWRARTLAATSSFHCSASMRAGIPRR
jgi:hypothetical protein